MFGLIGRIIGGIANKAAGGLGSLANIPGNLEGKLGTLANKAGAVLGDNGLNQLSAIKNQALNYQNQSQNEGNEATENGQLNILRTQNKAMQQNTELSLMNMVKSQTAARDSIWIEIGKNAKEAVRS